MGNLTLNGAVSGSITISPPSVAGSNTLTLPAVTDTITTNTATQTLTNKTLSSPTFTGTSSSDISTTGTVVMGSPYTMRNKIINGAMVIDQRNAGASVTPTSGAYTLDRWAVEMTQASKFTIQQNAGAVTPPAGFNYYLGATSSSAYTVTSTDYFVIGQAVEGFNCADLAFGTASAQTVTLSFWVRSSLTGTFGGTLLNSGASRNYVFSYSISAANTWEQKTVTISGDTSGTWLTTNGAGLYIRFCIGAGASVVGASGSWSATVNRSVTGQTSVVGTNGATFYITGVQLERGTVATPFEYRNYQQELAMCQRYCTVITKTDTTGSTASYFFFGSGNTVNTTISFFIPLGIKMRTAPSVSFSATSTFGYHAPGQNAAVLTAISLGQATIDGLGITGNTSNIAGNFASFLTPAANQTATITASAEL